MGASVRKLISTGLLLTAISLASTPSSAELQADLEAAKAEWGLNADGIILRVEPLSACPDGKQEREVANTQVEWMRSTITFEADPSIKFESTAYLYVIRINSNCNWNSGQFDLRKVVAHEYGHVLIGAFYHSPNPKSVMFWLVGGKDRKQVVLDEDKRMYWKVAGERMDASKGLSYIGP